MCSEREIFFMQTHRLQTFSIKLMPFTIKMYRFALSNRLITLVTQQET